MPPKKQQQQPAKKPTAKQEARRRRRAAKRAAKKQGIAESYKLAVENVRAKHPAQHMSGQSLTQMLALPVASNALRMPSMNPEKTGLLSLRHLDNVKVNVDTNLQGPVYNGWSYKDYHCAIYGQPGRMYVHGPVNVSSNGYPSAGKLYSATFENNSETASLVSGWTAHTEYEWFVDNVGADDPIASETVKSVSNVHYWPITGLVTLEQFSPVPGYYGGQPTRSIGLANESRFVHLNVGEAVNIIFRLEGLSSPMIDKECILRFSVQRWIAPNQPSENYTEAEIRTSLKNLEAQSFALFEASLCGYYSVKYEGIEYDAAVTARFALFGRVDVKYNIQVEDYRPGYVVVPAPEVGDDRMLGRKMRRIGMSVLVSSRAASLVAAGSITAGRMMAPGSDSLSDDALEMTRDVFTGHITKGVYTYLTYSENAELFETVALGGHGGLSYNLETPDWVHLIRVSSTGTEPCPFVVTTDMILEFKSESQRYDYRMPYLSLTELVEARKVANSTPFFFENPLHWNDIMNIIKRAWETSKPIRQAMVSGAALAFPQHAALIRAAGSYLP